MFSISYVRTLKGDLFTGSMFVGRCVAKVEVSQLHRHTSQARQNSIGFGFGGHAGPEEGSAEGAVKVGEDLKTSKETNVRQAPHFNENG